MMKFTFMLLSLVGASIAKADPKPHGYHQFQQVAPVTAYARIVPGGEPYVQGQLQLRQRYHGVMIEGYISGLTPGLHGFHIHEKGSLGNQCKDAGGHFNPFKHTHGDQNDRVRHVGDLGNIYADSTGTAYIEIFDHRAKLEPRSTSYIGNRAFVVHADPDDLGRGGDEGSLSTGNAGSRVGCGVIVVRIEQNAYPQTTAYNPYYLYQQPQLLQPFNPVAGYGSGSGVTGYGLF